jgi:hypothetical protein
MLKFLDGSAATAEIRRLVRLSNKVDMAVAFWGRGAAKELGLEAKGGAAQVICNLRTGGTNPDEIEKLIQSGVEVTQCDSLHGKLYLFDNCVIIGSSNASANGLALEGKELSGWQEANLLTDDGEVYKDAEKWLKSIPSQEITNQDLEQARDAFTRRRHAFFRRTTAGTLIDALKGHPEEFTSSRLYLCAYNEDLDRQQYAKIKRERVTKKDSTVSGFGWELPNQADLICFWVGSRGGIRFDDFWERPGSQWESLGSHPVWYAKKQTTFAGYDSNSIGPIAEWKGAVNRFVKDVERDGNPWHMDLGIFGTKYLR